MSIPEPHTQPLTEALALREREISEAIDRLRELVDVPPAVREAVELVRCLRRLAAQRSVDELYKAFGAPGDFGYQTPVGAALAKVYRTRSKT